MVSETELLRDLEGKWSIAGGEAGGAGSCGGGFEGGDGGGSTCCSGRRLS